MKTKRMNNRGGYGRRTFLQIVKTMKSIKMPIFPVIFKDGDIDWTKTKSWIMDKVYTKSIIHRR